MLGPGKEERQVCCSPHHLPNRDRIPPSQQIFILFILDQEMVACSCIDSLYRGSHGRMPIRFLFICLVLFVIGAIFFYGFFCPQQPYYVPSTDDCVCQGTVTDLQIVLKEGQDNTKQAGIMDPARRDVLTITPWLAPIVWEGTFDTAIINEGFKSYNGTIATTVFAVAKYTRYLQDFLETAEKHYMVGLNVHFYVFTDQPAAVPNVTLAAGRYISIIKVPKFSRWQEISMRRMEFIQEAIEKRIRHEVDYLFCVDVDMKFHSHVGAEILGKLVGVLNPWLHKSHRDQFSYERRPISRAYIPYGQGDYYYAGGFFGGHVQDVYKLVTTCRTNLEADKLVNVEAKWQEESHVNRYMLLNKPTKVLSPEYLWDEELGAGGSEIKLIRYATVRKNMKEVRENI